MLYTQLDTGKHSSGNHSKQIPIALSRYLLAAVLWLFSSSFVYAENNSKTLLIPTYDNTILNDGYKRWNKNYSTEGYVIHSSVLFENISKQNYDTKRLRLNDLSRHDRTSNHQPVRFNITMKGYSVYEANDDAIQFWSFDKIELNMNKMPELFFGVQKPFY